MYTQKKINLEALSPKCKKNKLSLTEGIRGDFHCLLYNFMSFIFKQVNITFKIIFKIFFNFGNTF